ncbi:uncharacterized protein LOC115929472 [Strongylocentrotus purpuratus]|uniref:Uncharacterized protein n=1 Tax=Strongylocentrotus purpuratus TaxID=7668 RepID=A0A7M7PTP5_STRPU|nr:uncharacterized protein LOC115929472 [Strongylocentrotus purpuratus]
MGTNSVEKAPHLTQLYGEPTQVSSRQLQRNYVKKAKLQNYLTFLKHCRDSSITPTGLLLKSSISTRRAKLIIHKAGQALVREGISNTAINSIPWSKTSKHQKPSTPLQLGKLSSQPRQKQIVKFNKLLANSQKSTNQTTSTGTKDTVINLSNHPLMETKHKVVLLGLNFAVSPKKIPFSEVIQQVEPKLRFLSRTAAEKKSVSKSPNPYPQLSHHNPTLANQNKPLSKIYALATERKLNQGLLSLHRTEVVSKPLYFKLHSSSATCPILFGQLKIHKPTIPLCPIISTQGSPCYDTAKHLTSILQPLIGQS